MKPTRWLASLSIGLFVAGTGASPAERIADAKLVARPGPVAHAAASGLGFAANAGQWSPEVRFVSREAGGLLYLTSSSAVVALARADAAAPSRGLPLAAARADAEPAAAPAVTSHAVVGFRWVGANPDPEVVGLGRRRAVANYFIGDDPAGWRSGVPTFDSVRYAELYSGVDLVFYGAERQLEYDFVVAPGADVGAIAIEVHGADRLEVDETGALVARTAAGDVVQRQPVLYQEVDGARRLVPGRFAVRDATTYGFEVGEYDRALPLVVDPEIVGTLTIGGSQNDLVEGIVSDNRCYTTAVGTTLSADLFDTGTHRGSFDAFVLQTDASNNLVSSIYLGTSSLDFGTGIALGPNNMLYVTGTTFGMGFPTTEGAFQRTRSGQSDAFVTAISIDESGVARVVTSTLLGGTDFENGFGIAVGPNDLVWVTGRTGSSDFPLVDPFQAGFGGGFADAFVTALLPDLRSLFGSSLWGGAAADATGGDQGNAISVDALGNVYVAGTADSANAPMVGAAQSVFGGGSFDGFLLRVSADFTLDYASYEGGSAPDSMTSVAAGENGMAYTGGFTQSADFVQVGTPQRPLQGGSDAFLAGWDTNATGAASLPRAVLIGGGGLDGIFDLTMSGAMLYATGSTSSLDLPVVNPLQSGFGGGDLDAIFLATDAAIDGFESLSYLGAASTNYGTSIRIADCASPLPANRIYLAGPRDVAPGNADIDIYTISTCESDERNRGGVSRFTADLVPTITDFSITLPDGKQRIVYTIKIKNTGTKLQEGCVFATHTGVCSTLEAIVLSTGTSERDPRRPVGTGGPIEFIRSDGIRPGEEFSVSIVVCYDTRRCPPNPNNPFAPIGDESFVKITYAVCANDPANDEARTEAFIPGQPGYEGVYLNWSQVRLPRKTTGGSGDAPSQLELTRVAGTGTSRFGAGSTGADKQLGGAPSGVLSYNIYASAQPGVAAVPANLVGMVPADQFGVDVSKLAAGSYFVVTAVYAEGESAPSNEVGGATPTLERMTVADKKITVQGSGFAAGVRVLFGSAPFQKAAKVKSGGAKVVQKSPLADGRSLGAAVAPGESVFVTLRNPNGVGVGVFYEKP